MVVLGESKCAGSNATHNHATSRKYFESLRSASEGFNWPEGHHTSERRSYEIGEPDDDEGRREGERERGREKGGTEGGE